MKTASFVTEYTSFVNRTGTTPTRNQADPESFRLSNKAARLRHMHKNGELDSETIALVETIPGWEWTIRTMTFSFGRRSIEDMVAQVIAFINEHDTNPKVSKSAASDEEATLGNWMINVRAKNNRGELTAADIAKIETIPGWVWKGRNAKLSINEGLKLTGGRLTRFLNRMRRDRVAGKLTAREIARIEAAVPTMQW
jgi:hypothetical protein